MPRFLVVAPILLSLLVLPIDASVRTFGEPSSDAEIVAIETLVADPDAWAGRSVRVHGTITDVCPKKGCWMELRDADDARLRIKVEDDVIVFPVDAKGLEATAHGVVRVIDMERDRYVAWVRHLAEEKGESFDPASVGDGPYRIVQIQGDGATIGTAE
ncbi:MAG: DUF4920 domain-containing protein [Acidobacteriota bacterium]